MKSLITTFLAFSFVLASLPSLAGNDNNESNASRSSISGQVIDNKTGESLAGVVVSIENTDIQVYTDLDGNFEINQIVPGTYNLVVSYISYKSSLIESLRLDANEKENINVKLNSIQ